MALIRLEWVCLLWFVFVGWNDGAGLGKRTAKRMTNEWLPFECNEKQADNIRPDLIKRFLIHQMDLYFFFEDFAVKLDAPLLEVVEESGVERHSLRYRNPTYRPFSSLVNRPTVLSETYENTTALLQKLTVEPAESYLIVENGLQADYKMQLNQLVFGEGKLGDVVTTVEAESLKKNVKKNRKAIGFVRYDSMKWLEYWYINTRILFLLYRMNEASKQLQSRGMAALKSLDYLVKRAAYYQTAPGNESSWAGNLVEIDAQGLFYLRHAIFSDTPETNFTVHTLFRTKLSLKNLLGCVDQAKPKKQLKGLFYRTTAENEKIASLFVDDYYFRLRTDPVQSRFTLDDADDLAERRVIFKEPYENRPQIERLAALKLIKNIEGTPYLTFDHKKSYSVAFEGSAGNERLVAIPEGEVLAHLCPYQTLSINSDLFCFRKRSYQLVSKDLGLTPFAGRSRPISELFEGSTRMQYGDEDLELIVADDPTYQFTDETKLDISFVFASWLLKFDSYLFRVLDDRHDPNDREIRLRYLENVPSFMFERRQNCYYNRHNCPNYASEQVDTYPTPSWTQARREIAGPSIVGLLLVLVVLFALVLILAKMLTLKSNEIRRMLAKTRDSPALLRARDKMRIWTQLARKKGTEMLAKRRRASKTTESAERVSEKRSLTDLKSVKSLGSKNKSPERSKSKENSKEKSKENSKEKIKEKPKAQLNPNKPRPKTPSLKRDSKDAKAKK